ncbi:hypothetical protein [uncultured Ruegeria sp.]|uniref:hypothetical protein n=1 Tax=uncultured Ruegeria sp. TaxID=259304 RepID=UPI00262FD5F4|nr:hypothetical protein [uncultured Ruegeria sp.]
MRLFAVLELRGNKSSVCPTPASGIESDNGVSLCFWLSLMTTMFFQPTNGLAAECAQISALENYENTGVAPIGSVCQPYDGLGNSRGVSCYWEFQFRSDGATSYFDDTWAEVAGCRNGTPTPNDRPVNHPDSYEIRELNAGIRVYRVTLKDKGQEKRTLVFLSVEHSN